MNHAENEVRDGGITRHKVEMDQNRLAWERKPSLRACYDAYYKLIASRMAPPGLGPSLEIGSGMGNIKRVLPDCITSDIFDNPWLDCPNLSAYTLPFGGQSIANIILFDVFHHLRYPATALNEFGRALAPGGRVILFEPGFGLLGRAVYEFFHHEPCGFDKPIEWEAPAGFSPESDSYYAAQGNAWRLAKEFQGLPVRHKFRMIEARGLSAIAYIGTGGFRGPSLYPPAMYPALAIVDHLLSKLPGLFAARLLLVMERL